jgi:hypothetical protein
LVSLFLTGCVRPASTPPLGIAPASGTAVAGLGIAPEVAARGIAALQGIPGRMERIDLGQNFTAIVDFAHTPNALKRTLETARQMLMISPRRREEREGKSHSSRRSGRGRCWHGWQFNHLICR